jgi:hypothetical protein
MRLSKQTFIWLVICAIGLLHACSEPRNFDDEIRAADSLNTQMDKTLVLIDTTVHSISDSIEKQILFFQKNSTDVKDSLMSQALLRYAGIRNNIALLDQWRDSLRNRQDKIENELVAFRNALADKATHDGLNHEINQLYADTVLQNLIEKQQYWHTKINEWLQQQKSICNNWNTLNDTILTWRQSISKQKQPA